MEGLSYLGYTREVGRERGASQKQGCEYASKSHGQDDWARSGVEVSRVSLSYTSAVCWLRQGGNYNVELKRITWKGNLKYLKASK
ncbi:hypothetical protein VNO78_16079 [Psophocarpus tetragonolobus]|uniref:Uncharacterized protein n=1 Tax=Psophocarpus tetragonolobus TaxID=3891 RepID=A0AAN9XK59_PSOTE